MAGNLYWPQERYLLRKPPLGVYPVSKALYDQCCLCGIPHQFKAYLLLLGGLIYGGIFYLSGEINFLRFQIIKSQARVA